MQKPNAWLALARPRRFGKTLFISTLEAFFKGRTDLFEGLAAEGRFPDVGADTVLRLNFARLQEADTEAELFERLRIMAMDACCRTGLVLPAEDEDDGKADAVQRFLRLIRYSPASSVVLLIDEYDAPLTRYLQLELS